MGEQKTKRLGILTAGGDCPGLNAVIRAAVKTAMLDHNMEVIGFIDGFEGLVNNEYKELTYSDVSGILTLGGTILGTSNTANPWRWPKVDDKGEMTFHDVSKKACSNFKNLDLDGLIAIGGDGTMHIAQKLIEAGVPVVGVPKTIDNDLYATDYTFGFYTAVGIATEAIDRIHTTALSHHRVMIIEMMGRYAGWITLYAGVAGGADVILLPEFPYDLDVVAEVCTERDKTGKRFSIIAVAEGAKPRGGDLTVKRTVAESTDPIRLGGVGHRLAADLEDITHLEPRVTILGYLQRGGTPCSFDRLLATSYGSHASNLAAAGKFGRTVCLKGDKIEDVPVAEAISQLKLVTADHHLIRSAISVGTSFGSKDV